MKIGQKIYLKPIKHSNAYKMDKLPIIGIVEKVGRKYVTIKQYGRFNIQSGMEHTNYSPEYKLYESKEKLKEVEESEYLSDKIRSSISRYGTLNIGIDKIRQIAIILNCT